MLCTKVRAKTTPSCPLRFVTDTPVAVAMKPTSTSRWFGSLECVVASGRTRTTDVIGAACVVVNAPYCP